MHRPEALLVMRPDTYRLQFGAEELRRLRALAELGDPVWTDDLDTPRVRARLAETEVLLTSWGCPVLTEERLDAAPKLRAVFHCAGSVRPIVSDAVWRRDVLVTSAAEANATPVAEYTLAAIIFAGKQAHVLAAQSRLKPVDWYAVGDREDLSNYGRTIGIVGFSRIGRRVLERLRALDTAAVLVADPYADSEAVAAAGGQLVELDEVLKRSEILSLHLPELPQTRGSIGARELALLPDGATVVNTARGSVIDTAALERECASGRLNAILDVTDPEPLPADSLLPSLPNVMITPHIAGSLGTETRRMSAQALSELERFVRGEAPLDAVTREVLAVSA
ncbi:D-isomer specific 2-hydroxyacid dehydrogenase NAD-binding [Catenulispora acidiphila DSM 44928]|uniref:D-isomer specific 2-hydroxyacid dehydrogenase NAD-binding n=1 Tax=Catenulispora acidiphila (strain DSM 44928 / JCM 14897 / NBRC 102108 / NRRL B-24433 / ID139908) TaxID=479433 RepID=C7QDB8_CATAD|nr:hydroxyacid dehydrogenase [Catenulispora acidiphila]ACU72711.1 D-isomer specific 2-hydroxyacid dehydrogenase NAD-binding [Catenulispora acidiphila DSM 44928]